MRREKRTRGQEDKKKRREKREGGEEKPIVEGRSRREQNRLL
jgi:hypothetical protein